MVERDKEELERLEFDDDRWQLSARGFDFDHDFNLLIALLCSSRPQTQRSRFLRTLKWQNFRRSKSSGAAASRGRPIRCAYRPAPRTLSGR
jgi:hypothetical protein